MGLLKHTNPKLELPLELPRIGSNCHYMVLRVRRGGHNERTGVFLDRAFSRQIAPARPSRPVKSSFCCEIEVANRASNPRLAFYFPSSQMANSAQHHKFCAALANETPRNIIKPS